MAPESAEVLRLFRLRRQLRSARATWAAHLRACAVCQRAPAAASGRCQAGRLRFQALQEASRVWLAANVTPP